MIAHDKKVEKVQLAAKINDPEEEYNKLIRDVSAEDPWKEPIKDLIDQYASIADKARASNDSHEYGSQKPTTLPPKQSVVVQDSKPSPENV